MEVKHQLFESMLHARDMTTKRAFSEYSKIPYYTVAGWKKSGKVPPYVMVLLTNMPSSKTVTAQQLIDTGVPRAIFWNNDLMHYRITYLPQHILQLMEVKKEDPFDIEGIEKPTMKMKDYTKLKTYLLKEIREIV